jgi:tRNA pseudouridine38-40 synthase
MKSQSQRPEISVPGFLPAGAYCFTCLKNDGDNYLTNHYLRLEIEIGMARYFMSLSFKGTRYRGWQVQPNGLTVQEVLETTMSTFFRQKIEITGAGRTDTGVHASYYVAHFDTGILPFPPGDLVEKLNRFLPADIALHRIWQVGDELHARFSACKRTYRYYISRVKDPFTLETSFACYRPLDVASMNESAALLLDFTDFTSFSKLHTDVKTNNCRIFEASWREEGHQLVFTISADRFLRNMVRAIVGTLLEVGRGRLTPEGFAGIIRKKDRSAAGTSAPAQGLFLSDVEYEGTGNQAS